MKRRSYLKAMLAAGVAGSAAKGQKAERPIVLDVDLSVDPSKEQEMLHHFHNTFKPAAVTFPGYVDAKMCKLRSALQGSPPAGVNYRFQLTYRNEELRQKWVASDTHQKVWLLIENTLKSKNYTVLLFDSM